MAASDVGDDVSRDHQVRGACGGRQTAWNRSVAGLQGPERCPRLSAIRWDAAQRIMDRAVARGPAPRQRVTRLHFGD
jgi:hypothetical protein